MDSYWIDYEDQLANLLFILFLKYLDSYIQTHYRKLARNIPPRESERLFQALVQHGHPQRCRDLFRMPLETFLRLHGWLVFNTSLKDSRSVSALQKLAIFLRICGYGLSQRIAAEVFQHSGDTISR